MKTAERAQFVTDGSGRRVGVILDLKAYQRLRDAEEELADIETYDAARPRVQAEIASGEFATLAVYHKKRSRKRT